MSSKLQPPEQQQIKLINELSKLQHNFEVKQQTIILYDLYSTLEEDKIFLQNLHTIAQILIDPSLSIDVERVQIGYQTFFDKLTVSPGQAAANNIIKKPFEVEESKQGQTPLNNIFLYEPKGGKIRVVVIPIQKDLADISKLREEQEKLEFDDKTKKKQFSDKNLQYDALKYAQAQWQAQKATKFNKTCQQAKDKHLKMFKIEAFIGTILQKTKTYSICSVVQVKMRRYPKITEYLEREFVKIFSVPKGVNPQFIFYNYNARAPSAAQANNPLVTTRLQVDKNNFQVGVCESFNPKFFYEPQNVRTQIYANMEISDNKAINKVIQDFVDTWNNITVNTASCIGTVVKLVNQNLNKEKKIISEDQNASLTDLNSSTQISSSFSFQQVFEKYISSSLQFPKTEKLQDFYTDLRLGTKIKIEKGYPKIPSSIQCLVFIHFFYQLILQFSERYRQTEITSKNDQITLLYEWKRNLKQLYELVSAINKTFLNTVEYQGTGYYAKDMQRFFDFLMFTFESSQKIKKITKRDIATASSLKSLFDQFKPKKDKLLSFIIANEKSIKSDEPIHYYDLYLLIIDQNASQDMQNDLEYIKLHVHELKAFRIATQYIWDNQKLVEAIKSYALIALKYEKLNEKKRQLIDILQIEKRMARLLKIVGQEQFAAEIYFKNRELFFANNCCKQVLSKYKGDDKASLLIRWGEKFEKQFQYDLANSYYLMAFSYAKSASEKKKALQHKMTLLVRRSKLPSEDDTAKHDKFIKDQNLIEKLSVDEKAKHEKFTKDQHLIEFCNQTKLGDIFKKLRKHLTWDNVSGCSILAKTESAEVDPDSTQHEIPSEAESSPEKHKN